MSALRNNRFALSGLRNDTRFTRVFARRYFTRLAFQRAFADFFICRRLHSRFVMFGCGAWKRTFVQDFFAFRDVEFFDSRHIIFGFTQYSGLPV